MANSSDLKEGNFILVMSFLPPAHPSVCPSKLRDRIRWTFVQWHCINWHYWFQICGGSYSWIPFHRVRNRIVTFNKCWDLSHKMATWHEHGFSYENIFRFFYVLLTVHLEVFVMKTNLMHSLSLTYFSLNLYMYRPYVAHHQEICCQLT
jgi:hypothetical protein